MTQETSTDNRSTAIETIPGLTFAKREAGHRYTPEEIDEVYSLWVSLRHEEPHGALQRLSQKTGIRYQTLKEWSSKHRWRERWVRETRAVVGSMIEEAQAYAANNMLMAMQRLVRIIDKGSDKDAINAIKLFAEITTLIRPASAAPGPPPGNDPVDEDILAEVRELSPEELFDQTKEITARHLNQQMQRRGGAKRSPSKASVSVR